MSYSVLKITMTALLAAGLLSACDKSSNPSQSQVASGVSTTAPVASTASATMSHQNHDMSHMNHNMSGQPAHVTAYMQSMDAMHNAMKNALVNPNADVAFNAGMIPHHQGAIEMAKIQLQYGKDAQLRQLAQTIMTAQQGEIDAMKQWLTAHQNVASTAHEANPAHIAEFMNISKHADMMTGIMDSDPDVAFAKGMIPHHQGAIEMADIELKYGKNEATRALAKKIKAAQNPEIQQLQDWLKTHAKTSG